jgi:hypothetical protein
MRFIDVLQLHCSDQIAACASEWVVLAVEDIEPTCFQNLMLHGQNAAGLAACLQQQSLATIWA